MKSKPILKVINYYQKGISPMFGSGKCRFYPSCSQYAKEAVEKYGAKKGMFLAMKRFLRCNPFSKGGFDPVP